MITLPSPTSHILQTSNVICFKPFNTTFKNTTPKHDIYDYKTSSKCHLQLVMITWLCSPNDHIVMPLVAKMVIIVTTIVLVITTTKYYLYKYIIIHFVYNKIMNIYQIIY